MEKLIEGRMYLCTDGSMRKLVKIEADFLTYAIPIRRESETFTGIWWELAPMRREEVEEDFLNGEMFESENEIDVWKDYDQRKQEEK